MTFRYYFSYEKLNYPWAKKNTKTVLFYVLIDISH